MKTKILLIAAVSISMLSLAQGTLYYNGKIFTADTTLAEANFFVVENGIITLTGRQLDSMSFKNFKEKIDLGGKTVLPGIVDSHIHFIDGGLGLLQISFLQVTSRDQLIDKVNATKTQLIDGMYIGRDLGDEVFEGDDRPILLLDRLFLDTPAIFFGKSGHSAVVNHAALKKLGFISKTIIPDGTIQKNGSEFTGLLLEAAAMEANRIISGLYSSQTIQKAIMTIQDRAIRYGITTIGDNTFNPYFYKIYQELQKSNQLKIRVRARSYGRIAQTETLMKGVGRKHLGFIGGGVDPMRINYHAMKFFEDQSLSTTIHKDKHLVPGGKVFLNEQQLDKIFQMNPKSTFAFHVQGQEGIQNILNALAKHSSEFRHVIDHAGYILPEQLQQIGSRHLGLTVIGGQMFDYKRLVSLYQKHAPSDFKFNEDNLLNTSLKYQLTRAALTSDFPYGMDTTFVSYKQIDGLNPFPMIALNATGRYPDGTVIDGAERKKLSIKEAVNAFTTNGAFVLGEENSLGKIKAGYRADFIILRNNFFEGLPIDVYNEKVITTYIDGECVYQDGVSDLSTLKAVKVSPTDFAISPVIGYDPTLGIILGGAYFKFPLKTPGRYFDVQIQNITGGKFNTQVNYTNFDFRKNVNVSFNGSYSNFFQYYFGEGNRTNANDYVKLYAATYRFRPELTVKLTNSYQLNVFVDVRGRHETLVTDKNGVDQKTKLFQDENVIASGFSFQKDTRDNAFSTRMGKLNQIEVLLIPSGLNAKGLGDVFQINLDFRNFHQVGNSNIIFASHLAAGYAFGSPSYLFRYSLGGAYSLRGFYANRFRGDKYYAAQVEARLPIYKRFSGVAFFDAGDVTDDTFIKPKFTYGGGIRFALSQNIKLRLDYGLAKDQSGVFFTFSEAF